MIYKREESFRFQFQEPIEAVFVLTKEGIKSSKKGKALILDISPNGIKFSSTLDLPANDRDLLLTLEFKLNDKDISFPGHLIWKKKTHTDLFYGFQGILDKEIESYIVDALKQYVKQNKH